VVLRLPVITSARARIAYVHDVLMSGVSFVLSNYLVLGERLIDHMGSGTLILGTALFALIAAVMFLLQPMYKGIWRYASLPDLLAITRAVTMTILVFVPLMFMVTRLDAMPRSAVGINWFVLLVLLGGPRFLYRVAKDRRLELRTLANRNFSAIPVLLVGAGDGAELFLRSLHRQPEASYRVVGIVTRKRSRVGRRIHGVEILGTLDQVAEVVELLDRRDVRPTKLVVTTDDLPGDDVRALLETSDALGLTLARLPKPTDLRAGTEDRAEIRPVSVEDLLGRPQAVLDRDAIARMVAGRRVMVTGAGGSIGSELVRQVAALGPGSLTLLDSSEFALYSIHLELSERPDPPPLVPRLACVRDRRRLDAILAEDRPEVVFHAAALKHVPLVEMNPLEGFLTNTVGTRHLADACRANGVGTVVMISTDKAVNPTNIMGASKRMAESYCQALDVLDSDQSRRTRFVTVRFGNVLGSTGSVVPLFQRQLAAGGPITVTHPDMTRYFMTIREAVELVLQAAALGSTQDVYRGRIFVLDMGQPVRIVDLARQMIRLVGLKPDQDIEIVFTGPRPGEKLFEEIFHGAEEPVPTGCEGVLIADPRRQDHHTVAAVLDSLERQARSGAAVPALDLMRTLVPEYHDGADRPAACG